MDEVTDKIADQGFGAVVTRKPFERTTYLCGHTTAPECKAALEALYPSEDIMIGLDPLSPTTCRALWPPLKVNEVRHYP